MPIVKFVCGITVKLLSLTWKLNFKVVILIVAPVKQKRYNKDFELKRKSFKCLQAGSIMVILPRIISKFQNNIFPIWQLLVTIGLNLYPANSILHKSFK